MTLGNCGSVLHIYYCQVEIYKFVVWIITKYMLISPFFHLTCRVLFVLIVNIIIEN